MDAFRKLMVLIGAASLALMLVAGPALAVDDAPGEAPATEEPAGERIPIAESPRDRLGVLILGAFLAAGGLAFVNARRQLKGERPQASGEFRWR